MASAIAEAQWNGRLSSRLMIVLACLALGLSTIGLYAVATHGVSQRTKEIGLRMRSARGAGICAGSCSGRRWYSLPGASAPA